MKPTVTLLAALAVSPGPALAQPAPAASASPELRAQSNLAFEQAVSPGVRLSGNVYLRDLRTRGVNGDVNEGSLDQAVYQPGAAERAAAAVAGPRARGPAAALRRPRR